MPRNLRRTAVGLAATVLVYVVLLVASAGTEPFPAGGFLWSGAEHLRPRAASLADGALAFGHDTGQILVWIHTMAQWPLLALALLWLARRDPAVYARLALALLLTATGGLAVFAASHSRPDREASLGHDYLALPGVGTSAYVLIAMAVVTAVTRARIRTAVLLATLTTTAAAVLATDRHLLGALLAAGAPLLAWYAAGRSFDRHGARHGRSGKGHLASASSRAEPSRSWSAAESTPVRQAG
ncbi:hypothetical protein ACH4TV_47340 [Streptomyces sp. NPDC020898]|uniref:hypothetical protein n=1 Tax=Streptomyces sp. NPDC020898 TaxID=3365101 RepID=UPI0037A91D4E